MKQLFPPGPFVLFATLLLARFRTAANDTNKTIQLPPDQRPATWAVPMREPGLSNLHQVSSVLFRGAQPLPEGFSSLQKMGIKTVVDLRGFHDDEPPREVKGLKIVTIRFHTWHPEDEDMVAFLKVMNDPARQPVFVHCKRGIDRTGTMVALYRIAIQGWTKDEALREMTQGGFGYDDLFPNLVEYVRKLDVEKIKQEAQRKGKK